MNIKTRKQQLRKIQSLEDRYFDLMDEKNKAYTWSNYRQDKREYRQRIIDEMSCISKKIKELRGVK